MNWQTPVITGAICLAVGFITGIGFTLVYLMKVECRNCGRNLKESEDVYAGICDKCWKEIHKIQKQ